MSDTSTNTTKGRRTPALEYAWFNTLIEKDDANGHNQKARLKDFEGLKIANVDLDKILDLGFAYAPLPLINWLGFSSKIVSGRIIKQAHEKVASAPDGAPPVQGLAKDYVVSSRLTSVVNIQISFTHGTTIISGEIAASKMAPGDKFTSKAYNTKKFSIGFPARLTATKGEGAKKTPLYPAQKRGTKEDSNKSKGISKILFQAWCLHLPLEIYDSIGDITMLTRSKSDKIAPKFKATLLSDAGGGGNLLQDMQVIDGELVEESLIFTPQRIY
ncbi:hypothetical protein [Nostoc sp.]|uniref:hypothetical protein n=1 Tax=Nostoc sp. TaxID=1180 RepID=UPI002FF54EB2